MQERWHGWPWDSKKAEPGDAHSLRLQGLGLSLATSTYSHVTSELP